MCMCIWVRATACIDVYVNRCECYCKPLTCMYVGENVIACVVCSGVRTIACVEVYVHRGEWDCVRRCVFA
jgi:hypothetical protein